jgi:26S proteasome regulatory subunit N5
MSEAALEITSTKKSGAKDYTTQVNDAIKETQQALDTRGASALEECLDRILSLEKQCRQSGDGENVTKLLAHVVDLCVQAKCWDRLVELCDDLSKKRNQIK